MTISTCQTTMPFLLLIARTVYLYGGARARLDSVQWHDFSGDGIMESDRGGGGPGRWGMTRVGIALSGGGHRATIWGLGVLLYLADAGRQGDVGAIASVSGGSIANGVVAHEMDYASVGADEVRVRLRPLLRHVAYTGLFFWGPSTNAYVVTVLALLGVGALAFVAGLVMAFVSGGRGPAGGVPVSARAVPAG